MYAFGAVLKEGESSKVAKLSSELSGVPGCKPVIGIPLYGDSENMFLVSELDCQETSPGSFKMELGEGGRGGAGIPFPFHPGQTGQVAESDRCFF